MSRVWAYDWDGEKALDYIFDFVHLPALSGLKLAGPSGIHTDRYAVCFCDPDAQPVIRSIEFAWARERIQKSLDMILDQPHAVLQKFTLDLRDDIIRVGLDVRKTPSGLYTVMHTFNAYGFPIEDGEGLRRAKDILPSLCVIAKQYDTKLASEIESEFS